MSTERERWARDMRKVSRNLKDGKATSAEQSACGEMAWRVAAFLDDEQMAMDRFFCKEPSEDTNE